MTWSRWRRTSHPRPRLALRDRAAMSARDGEALEAAPRRTLAWMTLIVFLLGSAACGNSDQATPTPIPTSIPVPVHVPIPSPMGTPAPAPIATPTIKATSTPTAAPTPTPASTPTATSAPTLTSSLTATSEPTASPDVEVTVKVLRYLGLTPKELQVEVFISPKKVGVSGAQVVLSFDPGSLEALELVPGPFLGASPLVLRSDISEVQGLVTFTAARRGPTHELGEPGALVTLRLRRKEGTLIPKSVVRVETLELTVPDFKFIQNVGLAVE